MKTLKYFITASVCSLLYLSTLAQDVQLRIAQVQFHTTEQNGVDLSGTLSESIVGVDEQSGILIISGYYAGMASDSISSIQSIPGGIAGLSAYPNPTRDGVILDLSDGQHQAYSVMVYSVSGKLLWQQTWDSDRDKILVQLSAQPAGLYFITVTDTANNRQSTLQIAKQ